MQKPDRAYIIAGQCRVIVGMVCGVWPGAAHQSDFANSHAHINLLGFVTSVLFGMLFWAFPGMARSRAAVWQFLTCEIGTVLLVIGKILVDRDGTGTLLLQIGSTLVIVGTLLMLWLFATKAESRVV